MQTGVISPCELKHLPAWGIFDPSPAWSIRVPFARPHPTLFGTASSPHLQAPTFFAHPSVRTICQLPLGRQPGAGHALTPAMPQQHCLLGSASLCQLLIVMSPQSRPETLINPGTSLT